MSNDVFFTCWTNKWRLLHRYLARYTDDTLQIMSVFCHVKEIWKTTTNSYSSLPMWRVSRKWEAAIRPLWIWKGVSATLQSGRYTLSNPRGRVILVMRTIIFSLRTILSTRSFLFILLAAIKSGVSFNRICWTSFLSHNCGWLLKSIININCVSQSGLWLNYNCGCLKIISIVILNVSSQSD